MLPLYKGLHAPSRPDSGAHMGLWFERYFSAYPPEFDSVDETARGEWLKTCVRQQYGGTFLSRLQDKAVRTLDMARSFGGDARIFHCAGRFVTGTGNAHPLENGFTWHHSLGMPYLPGSAVKGLVRAVIETALDDSEAERKRLLKLWFGTEAKGDVAEQAGALIFLDALPVAPCDLKAEVLTPHMGKWYEKGGKDPMQPNTMPGDWHSPVPVLWLAASNLQLQFTILPRAGMQDAVKLDEVWAALEYGLGKLGAGAKTAIGYGLFEFDSGLQSSVQRKLDSQREELAAAQQQQAMEDAPPVQRSILQLQAHLATLPDNMPASDARFTELWQMLSDSIALVSSQGSTEEKAELLAVIKAGEKQKFSISKKKEKDYKAMLTPLRT
ncbi:type III-B CRISPR module RAMP protein Cmr6 [Azotobacter salinestris]|uniref:type III-B CRISPR module RAMP protein Cmr6 n=1 Tax=Azotobacter salinestris TaxID=69964 RepID=UPI0032E045D4